MVGNDRKPPNGYSKTYEARSSQTVVGLRPKTGTELVIEGIDPESMGTGVAF